jgi:hypothetical protein
MSITVETGDLAPDHLLTTLETVKLSLGITDSGSDDAIERLILEASGYAYKYTNRIFAKERVTEHVIGRGLPEIILSRTPIISIEEVLFKTTVQSLEDFTIIDNEAGIVQRLGNWTDTSLPFNSIDRQPSSYGKLDWHITYLGGYVLPNWEVSGDERSLPYDLERAVIEAVRTFRNNDQFGSQGIDSTVKSYKIGDTQITWGSSSSEGGNGATDAFSMGMPPKTLSVLNFYRRIK